MSDSGVRIFLLIMQASPIERSAMSNAWSVIQIDSRILGSFVEFSIRWLFPSISCLGRSKTRIYINPSTLQGMELYYLNSCFGALDGVIDVRLIYEFVVFNLSNGKFLNFG